MTPRCFLTASTLLAFLMTQGICDRGGQNLAAGNGAASSSRSHLLRPSVEGVQSGLEEKLRLKNAVKSVKALELLSELILRPIDFDWSRSKPPKLQGLSIGITNSQGRISFTPETNFNYPWQALGFGEAGWEGIIEKSGVKHNLFEFTVRFQKAGRESFTRTFQIGRTTRDLPGQEKDTGRSLTVLEIDPKAGIHVLREIIKSPEEFRLKALLEDFPDLRGLRLGTTNTGGRIDIVFPRRKIYAWSLLGRAEKGWDAVIVGQKLQGEALSFTVRFTRGSKRILRTFQIHPGLTRELFGKEVLEISDELGLVAISRLVVKPVDFDWTREAKNLPDLAGLRIRPTDTGGIVVFTPLSGHQFHWPVLGSHSRGWKGIITKSGVQDGRYEFTVRFSKGKQTLTKTFQIGHYTRQLPGTKSRKGKFAQVLEVHEALGLRAVKDLITGQLPAGKGLEKELVRMKGLQLGTTRNNGQIVFRPFPYYEYRWPILGSYGPGWKAVIANARLRQGRVQLIVELTKEGEPPLERTFQVGPLQRWLKYAENDGRSHPRRRTFRLIHLETVKGLLQPDGKGARKSEFNARTQDREAVDSSSPLQQAASGEVFRHLDRVTASFNARDREIVNLILDGQSDGAIARVNGFSQREAATVRQRLQASFQQFIPLVFERAAVGLEEGETHVDEWALVAGELKSASEALQRLLTHPELQKESTSEILRIGRLTEAVREARTEINGLTSFFNGTPPSADQQDALISRAKTAAQQAWIALDAFDRKHREKFPEAVRFLSTDLPVYHRQLAYINHPGDWDAAVADLQRRKLLPVAGLEEQEIRRTMAMLDEATPQGDGILVLEAGALGRAGLEELVSRMGPHLGRRVVLFGKESAAAKEAAARSGVLLVDSDDLADLAFRLVGLEERVGRIGYVGSRRTADWLARILPSSMEVTPLDPAATLPDLFLFLGYPGSFLDRINGSGLEEALERSRAA